MKGIFLLVALCLIWSAQSRAADIHDLLDAAARQPGYEVSAMSVQESALRQESATAALFPKFGMFGRAESTNSPTNLRPMPPTEVNVQGGDAIPFSREILRYGLSFEAPVYVRELYVLRQKAAILSQRADIERKLDLLGREAAVVSLNSALAYLQGLEKAIDARRVSLAKTRDDMALKVQSGRAAESELLKTETTINDLDQQRNELTLKRLDTLREIKTLTGIELDASVPMTLRAKPTVASYLPVAAARMQADAAQKELERREAARYPTLLITGYLSGNDGEAYNTDSHIFRSYNSAALVLKFPLFDHSLTTDEAIARIQWEKAKKQLAQTQLDMASLADTLDRKLPVVERAMALAEKSIADHEALLAVAIVALRSGRMTLEDYLRYESNLLAAQAAFYQARQQRWQILAQQAVLSGTDLKGIVQ